MMFSCLVVLLKRTIGQAGVCPGSRVAVWGLRPQRTWPQVCPLAADSTHCDGWSSPHPSHRFSSVKVGDRKPWLLCCSALGLQDKASQCHGNSKPHRSSYHGKQNKAPRGDEDPREEVTVQNDLEGSRHPRDRQRTRAVGHHMQLPSVLFL